jgi:hypothetical protein
MQKNRRRYPHVLRAFLQVTHIVGYTPIWRLLFGSVASDFFNDLITQLHTESLPGSAIPG